MDGHRDTQREPLRRARLRRGALAALVFGAVGVTAAIYVLTEQAPDVTSEQSEFVNQLMLGLFGGIPGLYDEASGLWLGIHVRHWAHAAEFFALGLFVAAAFALARRRAWGSLRTAAASLAVCAACSLFDQTHKLFVPGRHFDVFDLVMDASGYCLAIAVVLAVSAFALRRT